MIRHYCMGKAEVMTGWVMHGCVDDRSSGIRPSEEEGR
jgi:hypothetical protein